MCLWRNFDLSIGWERRTAEWFHCNSLLNIIRLGETTNVYQSVSQIGEGYNREMHTTTEGVVERHENGSVIAVLAGLSLQKERGRYLLTANGIQRSFFRIRGGVIRDTHSGFFQSRRRISAYLINIWQIDWLTTHFHNPMAEQFIIQFHIAGIPRTLIVTVIVRTRKNIGINTHLR